MTPLIDVNHLSVLHANHQILDDVSFVITKGEKVGLIGASGAGKTVLAHILLGMKANFDIKGDVQIIGTSCFSKEFDTSRGKIISYVGQFPLSSFSPVKNMGDHFRDAVGCHPISTDPKILIHNAINEVGLSNIENILNRFPHQLSGGQLQRLSLAMSIIHKPTILILDEPTASLDFDNQNAIISLIRNVTQKYYTTTLWITHDTSVLEQICDRVIILADKTIAYDGRFGYNEKLPIIAQKFFNPCKINAIEPDVISVEPIIEIQKVSFGFDSNKPLIDNCSLSLYPGIVIGLSGQSGGGKSTLAKLISRELIPTNGKVLYKIKNQHLKVIYIDQEIRTVFNPKHKLSQVFFELIKKNQAKASDRQNILLSMLDLVNLKPSVLTKYPHQLSGGQLQQCMTVTLLLINPDVLIFDETFSALDPENKCKLANLLLSYTNDKKWAVLIISHDEIFINKVATKKYQLIDGRVV